MRRSCENFRPDLRHLVEEKIYLFLVLFQRIPPLYSIVLLNGAIAKQIVENKFDIQNKQGINITVSKTGLRSNFIIMKCLDKE